MPESHARIFLKAKEQQKSRSEWDKMHSHGLAGQKRVGKLITL
jgi:hypothetical protein